MHLGGLVRPGGRGEVTQSRPKDTGEKQKRLCGEWGGRELGAACLKRGRGRRKRGNGALESVFERGARGGQQTPALGPEEEKGGACGPQKQSGQLQGI